MSEDASPLLHLALFVGAVLDPETSVDLLGQVASEVLEQRAELASDEADEPKTPDEERLYRAELALYDAAAELALASAAVGGAS